MNLTSSIKPAKPKKLDYQYPGLYIANDGMIILMELSGQGTVVASGNSYAHYIGYHTVHWDMNVFRPFEGEVTIKSTKREVRES